MTNTLWDSIIETRFFDNNGKPVANENNAVIFIVHTDDRYFGDTWFAVSKIGGHQLGSEKTPELALFWGMKNIISDNAAQRDVRFERGELGSDDRRYQQKVIIDGEHRATFKPNSFGVEYDLVDLENNMILVHPEAHGYSRYPEATSKADMKDVVRRWFEFIPTDAELEKRHQQKLDQEKRQRIEDAEDALRLKKEAHADEMFDVIKRALSKDGEFVGWEKAALTVIAKIEGDKS